MMKYRGFSSFYSYCANKSENSNIHTNNKTQTQCPNIKITSDNILAPSNSGNSAKRHYARVVKYNSRAISARVGARSAYICK